MADTGIIKLHGREYKTVALRVHEFREKYPICDGWGICSRLVSVDEDRVVFRAMVVDPNGKEVAVGFAEERRDTRGINSTSALENCETSAIGRALAAAGFGGSEYASANELVGALSQQAAAKRADRSLQAQADAARKALHHDSFDPTEQRRFFVALGRLGILYESADPEMMTVKLLCLNNDWGYPSTWPQADRSAFVSDLEAGKHPQITRNQSNPRTT